MRFVDRYRRVIADIFGPAAQVEGFSEDEVRVGESLIGTRLPLALRDFYVMAGRFKPVTAAHNRFYTFDTIARDAGYLVFLEENQQVVYWGFAASEAAQPDPPVYQGVRRQGIEWVRESEHCSDFLVGMIGWQAVNGGLPSIGFMRITTAEANLLQERLPLIWQDRGFLLLSEGGTVVSLFFREGFVQVQAGARSVEQLSTITEMLQKSWEFCIDGRQSPVRRSLITPFGKSEANTQRDEDRRFAEESPKEHSVIRDALLALIQHNRNAFVFVKDRTSEATVEFTASTRKPLRLNLQTVSLSTEMRARAEAFFGQVEGSQKCLSPFDDEFEYQVVIGKDVERGAALALAVFRVVYQLPAGCELLVTRDWEQA